MAGYERNPKQRRRLGLLLVAGESVALGANAAFVFSAYVHYLFLRMNVPLGQWGGYVLISVFAAAGLAAGIYEGSMFLKGRPRFRQIMMIENALILVLGLAWFFHSWIGSMPNKPSPMIGFGGLVLPLISLFPLIWPLMTFKPKDEKPAGPRPASLTR
jgi:hypothetical protein